MRRLSRRTFLALGPALALADAPPAADGLVWKIYASSMYGKARQFRSTWDLLPFDERHYFGGRVELGRIVPASLFRKS